MITFQQAVPFLMIATAVLLVANAVWAFRDARQRGCSGVLITLLVFIIPFPIGVILWLLCRPALLPGYAPEEPQPEAPEEPEELPDADADLKRRANAGLL